MRKLYVRALLLALCLCFVAPLLATEWSAYPVPGAIIYVHPGQSTLARNIGDMVGAKLPGLAQFIGVRTPGPFPIYAYTDHIDFMRVTGINPDLLGVSMSPSGEILLDARGDVDSVGKTLAHELTHSLLNQRLGVHIGNLPIWVNEGIACHLSDPLTPQELPAVSAQIHRDGILTLDQLEIAFSTFSSRDAAYLQSRSMIAWLEYRHPGALRKMIDYLARGKTFETALYYAAHLTPDTWWQDWEEGVPAYFFWLNLLSSPAAYAPMAFLVILAAILRALRKRRDREETEEEDTKPVKSGSPLDDDLLEDQ